jgi:hypothetical protein
VNTIRGLFLDVLEEEKGFLTAVTTEVLPAWRRAAAVLTQRGQDARATLSSEDPRFAVVDGASPAAELVSAFPEVPECAAALCELTRQLHKALPPNGLKALLAEHFFDYDAAVWWIRGHAVILLHKSCSDPRRHDPIADGLLPNYPDPPPAPNGIEPWSMTEPLEHYRARILGRRAPEGLRTLVGAYVESVQAWASENHFLPEPETRSRSARGIESPRREVKDRLRWLLARVHGDKATGIAAAAEVSEANLSKAVTRLKRLVFGPEEYAQS